MDNEIVCGEHEVFDINIPIDTEDSIENADFLRVAVTKKNYKLHLLIK